MTSMLDSYKEDIFESSYDKNDEMTTSSLEPTNGGPLNNTSYNSYVDLFSCASLRIAEDDWNSLVNSDVKLAVQVGLLLLRNNKELETVLEVTEKQFEEQKLRADHYENQVKNLNELLNQQTDVYSSLETQILDLSNKYKQLLDDCGIYKKKNITLWRRVEWLEKECEEYLEEISFLKKEDTNSIAEESLECLDDRTPPSFENSDKVDTKLLNRFESILEENDLLKERILDLEHDNSILEEAIQRFDKNSSETGETKLSSVETFYYASPEKNLAVEINSQSGVKATPTLQHYHELFAEIFQKIKMTRDGT
uniref:Uncharacterized protein n=1 Tax=Clytia hemisphaerica TaxID=252671 RepID=A0A7M6DS56_9CNID|eukprot:TCONS_00071305-protein